MKHSSSRASLKIAKQYLKHEFRKIFQDAPKTWNMLDRSIETYAIREGDYPFWNLVAAISEGVRLKKIYHILSDTSYRWKLQNFPIEKLTLTGMGPTLDQYLIYKYKRSPIAVMNAWKTNKRFRDTLSRVGIAPHDERDHFPIFIFESDDGFRVFDGMRRTLLALMKGKPSIKAWVGHRVRRGKPLISGNRAYALQNLFEMDPSLEKPLIAVGKSIVKHFRNGRKTLQNRIARWAHDPKTKQLFQKIWR